MKKENIFDLYEQQNRKTAQPKPERLPEEVAPEEIEPEEPEGGEGNGV